MKKFSFQEREANIQKMQSQIFDLVIVGGGINGAGVARDASMRGMKVALVEARDFASGTSSRSSKLVHGGIRYLENMEFKLVFEALNERQKLFEMCPNLVHPLRFMIPLFEKSRVGVFKMGLGMWLYDALALFQAPQMHEYLTSSESVNRIPILQSQELKGSYVYSDGYMDDDRLVHETLRSANDHGAVIANYVTAKGVKFDEDGHIESLQCIQSHSGEQLQIKGKHFISTVGPWTDELGGQWFKDWKKVLRPTKGIHLTFSKERLPLAEAVVMGAENSNRIVFAIPRHEMTIVGTTDTDFSGSPQDVRVEKADVTYLLQIANQYFPGARLQEKDIVAGYAGVRPLVQDGSANEGKTSREHSIWSDPRGVTFVAGGKYTTYRLIAEEVVETALEAFDFNDRIKFNRVDTAVPFRRETEPDYFRRMFYSIEEMAREHRQPENVIRLLCERYGGEVEQILVRGHGVWNYWQLEAAQAIETTMCLNLVDFYFRRVPLHLAEKDHGLVWAESIAKVFQQYFSWDSNETQKQVEALKQALKIDNQWRN